MILAREGWKRRQECPAEGRKRHKASQARLDRQVRKCFAGLSLLWQGSAIACAQSPCVPSLYSRSDKPTKKMSIAWETKPRLTTLNQPVLLKVVGAMSRNPIPTHLEIPLTTGETYHADGKLQRIPRGEIATQFNPRLGTRNLTEIPPPVPMRVPMRTVRVPKGIGAIVVIDWATFVSEQLATAVSPLVDAYGEFLMRITALQDCELAEETALATQIKPQEAAQRLRAASMTKKKTARKTAVKVTRIRGYSRR